MTTNPTIFQKNIAASGTPEQLSEASILINSVMTIKAKAANTGVIYIGTTSAQALKTSANNFTLKAGESIDIKAMNAKEIWLDSSVSGEGVEAIIS